MTRYSFARVNASMQDSFITSMRVARGFAANPRTVMKPFQSWREERAKRTKLGRELQYKSASTKLGSIGNKTFADTKRETIEGTYVVWRPAIQYTRKRFIYPAQRLYAKSYDTAAAAKRAITSPFRAKKTAAKTPSSSSSTPPPNHTGSALALTIEGSKRIITENASAFSKHFRELMIDPNFKRRQFIHNLRKWEPKTHAGRMMAPLMIVIVFMMPVWAISFMVAQREVISNEARLHAIRKEMQKRSDPTSSLGLSEEHRRGSDNKSLVRSEGDALLAIFQTSQI